MPNNLLTEAEMPVGLFMHPAVVVLVIFLFVLIVLVNIQYATALMLYFSVIIPLGQGIKVLEFHFILFRIILFAGWIKLFMSGRVKYVNYEKTDKAMIYWVAVSFIAYIIQRYNVDYFNSVINRLGFAYNAIGTYFLYRMIIKDKKDISVILNTLAIVSATIAIFMLTEQVTGKNIFYIFGGVGEFTPIRDGSLRSQGPFGHPISAGMFGATMFPIYLMMWRHNFGSSFFGFVGIISACLLVITSSSSGPVISTVAGLGAMFLWPLRNHMGKVRFAAFFSLVMLHIIMKAPVWALIGRSAVTSGSTSSHRFLLVDNAINHYREWFFFGISSTSHWGYGMGDTANQYVFEAVNGGIFKLALFILIIVFNFSIIGEKIKIQTDNSQKKYFWALGSALFANIIGFFGIAYTDQILYILYLFLALITSSCLIIGNNEISKDGCR